MKARVILPLDACSALTLIIGIFCPQVEAAIPDAKETAFIANPRQLILAGRRSGEGYFSQDGHQLVFQAERSPENPFFQIFTLDFRSGDIQQVSPGMGKTTCSLLRISRCCSRLTRAIHSGARQRITFWFSMALRV